MRSSSHLSTSSKSNCEAPKEGVAPQDRLPRVSSICTASGSMESWTVLECLTYTTDVLFCHRVRKADRRARKQPVNGRLPSSSRLLPSEPRPRMFSKTPGASVNSMLEASSGRHRLYASEHASLFVRRPGRSRRLTHSREGATPSGRSKRTAPGKSSSICGFSGTSRQPI